MKLNLCLCLHYAIVALCVYISSISSLSSVSLAQEPPKPKSTPADLHAALNINDLSISMAESSFKMNPSLKKLVELAGALEGFLTKNCFGDLLKTLQYQGSPTSPDCIARMERLLEIYPNNPVAVCLRDGIEATSCIDAYRGQRTEEFTNALMPLEDIPDPALKVGLTASDNSKIRALEDILKNVNSDYQKATTDEDKLKYMSDAAQLYDRVLGVACKVSAMTLEPPPGSKDVQAPTEDSSIRDAREKLLKLPPALRPEYQQKMLLEAETELALRGKDTEAQKIILRRIEVINNPEDKRAVVTTEGKQRIRIILSACMDHSKRAAQAIPNFPSPVCHHEGWYSPTCIASLKKWRAHRTKMQEMVDKLTKKRNAPPPSVISSF